MTRRLSFLALILAAAACNSPAKPSQKGPATLGSISVTGQTTFSAINQTGQLTVFGNYSDGTRQDVTGQVTFTVQNPSVVTVSAGGAVKIVGYGSSSVTVTLQSITATVTISVTQTLTGLTINQTTVNLTAVGQTSPLVATATFADGSTKDVTSDAAWSSGATQVASVTSGLVTATGLGVARMYVRYPAVGSSFRSQSATVVVTPPGTFVASGGTRDPGNGPLSGVLVVHKPSGQSTTSVDGSFMLGGLLTDGLLSFDRSGYETAFVDTSTTTSMPLKSFDVPMQPVARVAAGDSIARTIAPHDMNFLVSDGVQCYPCQLVRVTTSSGGTLHLDLSWTETHSILHMWINGIDYPGPKVGPSSVSTDLTVASGEVLVYVGQASNKNAPYVSFALATALR